MARERRYERDFGLGRNDPSSWRSRVSDRKDGLDRPTQDLESLQVDLQLARRTTSVRGEESDQPRKPRLIRVRRVSQFLRDHESITGRGWDPGGAPRRSP